LGNYAFGYNEDHATGGTFRKEKGGPGVQVGSYGLRDADGRVRTVNYVADALGFRASVDTNEPGVDPHQPAAATTLNGAAPVVPAVVAAPVLAAPALAAAPLAAPLAAAPLVGAYGAPYAAGPLLGKGYAEPLLAAPLAIPSAYSVATQHVSAAPVLAAPALAAGPLAYGEPALLGKGLGYGGPALGLGYGAGKLGY